MSRARNCAEIAANEFTRRRRWAQRSLDDLPFGADRDAAAAKLNGRLSLWLSIAAMAGADLPELVEDEVQELRFFPGGRIETHFIRSRVRSHDIADRSDALAALAAARDAVPDAPQSADLYYLARALGAPPISMQVGHAPAQAKAA